LAVYSFARKSVVILIGLGANLASRAGPPATTIDAALGALESRGVIVVARSPFYESEPVPRSDQPWFVNAVARIKTVLGPVELLGCLHDVEFSFGRLRRERNEARPLDLDLLDYDGLLRNSADLLLPHPRLHERAFVLKPLLDVAPEWRHPILGLAAADLLAALPGEVRRVVRRLGASAGPRATDGPNA
jgi:2-amino-4-hydroxy-6-hydroxymethyldihydropteridine diphosphokinase